MILKFPIAPRPKERPRFSTRGGAVRTFTAPATRKFENEIAWLARKQLAAAKPLVGLLSAHAHFQFKRPGKTKLLTPKKDLDNLCKSIFDALNGIAYDDDTQIVKLTAHKEWGDEDLITLTLVSIVQGIA